jgi:hypothetical protein
LKGPVTEWLKEDSTAFDENLKGAVAGMKEAATVSALDWGGSVGLCGMGRGEGGRVGLCGTVCHTFNLLWKKSVPETRHLQRWLVTSRRYYL